MNPEELIFERHRGKKVLLDSNLLLLYLIGSFQRERIETFKRTQTFSLRDYDLLVALLQQFSTLVTTPHLLTEVSSLANALPSNVKGPWFEMFASRLVAFTEVFTPATTLSRMSPFIPFGIADTALFDAATDALVLTEDFRLAGFLRSNGIDTLNFRELALTL